LPCRMSRWKSRRRGSSRQAIGHGVGLKGGRYRSGIGYLNEQHPHQWDFANAPLMYNALFGQEASFREDGLQLKWLAPTPIFVEFGAEVGRGANFPGTDSNKNGAGAWAAYVHVGDDLGVSNSWRAGLSYLKTSSGNREAEFVDINGLQAQGLFNGDTSTWLADFVWKWAPDGNPKYQNFKFQSEYFVRKDKGDLTCTDENGVGNACDPLAAGPVTGRLRYASERLVCSGRLPVHAKLAGRPALRPARQRAPESRCQRRQPGGRRLQAQACDGDGRLQLERIFAGSPAICTGQVDGGDHRQSVDRPVHHEPWRTWRAQVLRRATMIRLTMVLLLAALSFAGKRRLAGVCHGAGMGGAGARNRGRQGEVCTPPPRHCRIRTASRPGHLCWRRRGVRNW
jgi:hypothetical protein